MIVTLSFLCFVGAFIAGAILGVHTGAAILILGFFAVCQGALIAAAQTRGFEVRSVNTKNPPYVWRSFYLDVVRLAMKYNVQSGEEPIFVWTQKEGYLPVIGLFTARINHTLSIVCDTSPTSEEYAPLAPLDLRVP